MDMWYPEYYKASIPNSIKPKPLTQTKPLTTPPPHIMKDSTLKPPTGNATPSSLLHSQMQST